MPKISIRNGNGSRAGTTKYDAHHKVLSQTYGAFADLRRELSDSKATVSEREEILRGFAACPDSQRAWLLLEDYFEKLSLSRRDFPDTNWWPRLLNIQGRARLEELAFLFLRAKRSVPPELQPHASPDRFARAEEAEQEQNLVQELENWLSPPALPLLDTPRASLRVVCRVQPDDDPAMAGRHRLAVQFLLSRPRTGEKARTLREMIDLVVRATHEQELFAPADWEFIQWIADTHRNRNDGADTLVLSDAELLQWLARWGHTPRLECDGKPLQFHGQVAALTPHLDNGDKELSFTHRLALPGGEDHSLADARFFNRQPPLALVNGTFYLLRNAPPPAVLKHLARKPSVPVRKLSHRLMLHLRKTQSNHGVDWEQLCVAHPAKPQFIFELLDDVVRLRLLARSLRDRSVWFWNSHEWVANEVKKHPGNKPEILDDPRLDPAIQWLRKLDWFTSEPGLWIGDANENFLGTLATVWAERPGEAEFLGNPAFHRLFLQPRQLKPHLIVKGSGIDWLAVSAEWEAEGLKLSKADLERLASATGRFVKLPNSGWVELDTNAVQGAHEAMAEMGVDGLIAVPQKVGMEHVAHLDENELTRFADTPEAKALRERVRDFKGVPSVNLPKGIAGRVASISKGRLRFSLPSHANQAWRHSGRRHGTGQNAAGARVAGVAQGAQPEKSQAVARHLPGVRAAQLAAGGGTVHAGFEGARARKRPGPAQPPQTDSAARFDRDELRAAAARFGGVAKIRVPRGDSGRGAVHQKSRRAGHPVGQAAQIRASPRAHRHAARKPAAGFVEHRGFHPARLPRQPGTISRNLRAARQLPATRPLRRNRRRAAKKPSPSSASRANGFRPGCARCCCAA